MAASSSSMAAVGSAMGGAWARRTIATQSKCGDRERSRPWGQEAGSAGAGRHRPARSPGTPPGRPPGWAGGHNNTMGNRQSQVSTRQSARGAQPAAHYS
eukprot:15483148-Alexandrium_andersonii.AAC.1